jgi:hypothetical protein
MTKPVDSIFSDVIFQRVPSTTFMTLKPFMYMLRMLWMPSLQPASYRMWLVSVTGWGALSGWQAVCETNVRDIGLQIAILHLPDWFVLMASHLFTAISNLTGWKPIWACRLDAADAESWFCIRRSRAGEGLGIHYTPIRQALTEAISSYDPKNSQAFINQAPSGDVDRRVLDIKEL